MVATVSKVTTDFLFTLGTRIINVSQSPWPPWLQMLPICIGCCCYANTLKSLFPSLAVSWIIKCLDRKINKYALPNSFSTSFYPCIPSNYRL